MKTPKKIKICIIRNDKIGDMILTLPVIKEIKNALPNSHIDIICSNLNLFLCKEAKFVDDFIKYDKKYNFITKLLFFLNLRKSYYDLVINLTQDLDSFIILCLSKSSKKSTLIYLSRYKNPKYSKIFQRTISKIFNIENIQIDRNKFFRDQLNFHQTEMMYKIVKRNINIDKPKTFYLFPKKNHYEKRFQKRILIHLSSKWIDNSYSENLFCDLLNTLKNKYGKIYLTTDETSKKSFKQIYNFYKKFDDNNLHLVNQNDNDIIILDKLNFENWRNVILNSKLVITYECGCVHVTSMSNVPLLVVYDFKNDPFMINHEYAPFTKKYEKVIVNQELINEEIMLKLKKFKINTYDMT